MQLLSGWIALEYDPSVVDQQDGFSSALATQPQRAHCVEQAARSFVEVAAVADVNEVIEY